MTSDENIKRLSRDILQQAQSEADQITVEAKNKVEQIKKNAEEEAAAERTRILDQAKRDAERMRSQTVATTQLKARTQQLEAREKLLTEVFAASMEKLPSVQQWSDYEAIVENLALEAIQQIGSKKLIIHADKFTHKLLADSLLSKIKAKFDGTIELGNPLEKGTGLIVTTEDGHLNFDNLLETRLKRLENDLRAPVYHLLLGESL